MQSLFLMTLGWHKDEAKEFIESQGYIMRITSVNGRPCIITADFRTDRVDVDVVNDIIVNAQIG